MNDDLRSYSQRSDGPTVDSLELAVSGSAELTTDVKRTQDVEVTLRGTVIGHKFTDKYDKNGDVAQTVKTATVRIDELVDIEVLTIPRRMKGQTAMPLDDLGDDEPAVGDVVIHSSAGEVVEEAGTPAPDVPPERHPQIPEDAWDKLNREQKEDIAARMDKIAARNERLADPDVTQTDRDALQSYLDADLNLLTDDYGIELLPAEAVERADEIDDGPPPRPVSATTGIVGAGELRRRRRYLLSKAGLPAEAERSRQEELAEIERRLGAGAPA